LLIAAGLLIKSVVRLQAVDPGFKSAGLVTMNVWLPGAKYPNATAWNDFYERMLARLSGLPGVDQVGLTSVLPESDNFDKRTVEAEGQSRNAGEFPSVDNYVVTPDYLRAMSIPLLRGRSLTARDKENAPLAVLVSETTARTLWPGEEAVGKRLRFYNSSPIEERPWRTVVGVVGDVKQYGLDTPGTMALYAPLEQMPNSAMTLVLHSKIDSTTMVASVRQEILALDREQAVFNVETMEQWLADSTSVRRFTMFLLGVFAGLALLLAAIGIYGVLAQTVAQRTHEIGIRMALGAQRRDVLQLIVRHGMLLTGIGVVAGLFGAFALTRFLASLLFQVGAGDPLTFIGIALLLIGAAFLACYFPARRAARLEPVVALTNG
jgi:putative ABC transport system permease protein